MWVRNIIASRNVRCSRLRLAAVEPPVANMRSTAFQASLPACEQTSRSAASCATVNGSPCCAQRWQAAV
jgi:hypothetical protein